MKFFNILIIICIITSNVWANNLDIIASPEDFAEHEKLMRIINKYSDLATKTRMNSDFVPGILSVMTYNEMEIAGFQTLEDVLKSMAGINVYIDTVGVRTVSIRGIGGAVATGNVKMMLNNIPLIDSLASLSDVLLDFPIALMDRIEVVRGPGSAIYGEYAYTGVINIITRKEQSMVSIGIGSLASRSSSALLNYESQDQSNRLSLMAHQFKTDGSDAITGPDAYYSQGPEKIAASLAPGSTNETLMGKSALISFEHHDTSFTGHMAHIYRGDYMGYYHYLYNLRDYTPHKLRQHALQLTHKICFNPQLNLIIKGGSQKYKFFLEDYYLYPPGHPDFPNFPDGIELVLESAERKHYANLDVSYHFEDHRLLFSLEYSSIKSLFKSYGTEMYRHVYSVVSQYECQPFENFVFTLGARYDNYEDDNYDDIDNNISPRISGVYHLSPKNIFKFQYQESFRPATTAELTYITDIKPPTINTYEFSYTYKSPYTRSRINLYHSILKNVIDTTVTSPFELFIYFNTKKIRSNGIEMELEHQLFEQLKINTNAAYMYTKNLDTNKSMPLQTHFIGNAGIIYSPIPIVNISTRYRYLGNRTREVGDNRNKLAGYHNLDMSMRIHATKISTKIRLGIDNVLNEDIRVPTPVAFIYYKDRTYSGDFPRKGRTMWFDISYEF